MNSSASLMQVGQAFDSALEVATVREGQPHVVILGAGASRQACPNGDATGRRLPLMNDLIDVVGLGPILAKHGVDFDDRDFEKLYSQLEKQSQFDGCRDTLESRVREYFSALKLPDYPTIYDHLVLSLRPRDVIATFNWDPFLVQAAQRNASHVSLPRLLFPHGNVAVGYCAIDKRKGPYPGSCPTCGEAYQTTQLVYPVPKKDYPNQPFIWDEWQDLRDALKEACVLTIFGFGAPETDVEAVELMRTAWPSQEEQKAQWVELVDIEHEDKLREKWDRFILSHHYDVTKDFYESRVARHPRRTGEAWAATHLFGMREAGNPSPRTAKFAELWAWFARLKEVEDQQCSQ